VLTPLLELTPRGLYCPPGDFHIDPWLPVPRALVTHAHADHARWGCDRYLAVRDGQHLLRTRLGAGIHLDTLEYGESLSINGVHISFHPAGHVLGSAQIRLEHHGEIVVVSGDYKLDADPTCRPFEPVRCHTFLTESTFGLPVYRWDATAITFDQVNDWWRGNRDAGKASLILSYALGKAQRVMAGVDATIGPIFTHGAVEKVTRAYRDSDVNLPPTTPVSDQPRGTSWAGALIVAPPSADGTSWARKFQPLSTAMASGWMRVRGQRRRRSVDRGFVLSDHADWPGLLRAIDATGAQRVLVTHGFSAVLARHLTEQGLQAETLATRYEGEIDEPADAEVVPA